MRILLNPSDTVSLSNVLNDAISSALELSIMSAYLTDWQPNQSLCKSCKELNFIVGTDFGITRKIACTSVLKWLPKHFKNDFLAADGLSGFHPKIVLWKNTSKKFNLLIGSSNLTQAAFTSNIEANLFSQITEKEYARIKDWVYNVRNNCSPISEDWLSRYNESARPKIPKRKKTVKASSPSFIVDFFLPRGSKIESSIKNRRSREKSFNKIRKNLLTLFSASASNRISNNTLYEKMMNLWGNSDSRIMGRGFEISGKHSNWSEACKSLLKILSAPKTVSQTKLDNIVKQEIDSLAALKNPNRGSWLSEMLCHFYPDKYPIVDKPVKLWLKSIKYRPPLNSSEGSRYIDLAIKLRFAMKENSFNSARNLIELDSAIWQWADNHY